MNSAVKTRAVLVEVTQSDIDNGIPDWSDSCAGSLALQRVFGPHTRMWNDYVSVGVNPYDYSGRDDFKTTKAFEEFGRRFDNGEPVKPHTFRLMVPESIPTIN